MLALNIDSMILSTNNCSFEIKLLLKTSRPGQHLSVVEFVAYNPDRRLCVVAHLSDYIERTRDLRGEEKQLLLSFRKPHKAASPDTVSRWIKIMLE